MIYGLSSFALSDDSKCSSFNIDVSVDSVSSYTVSLNQKSYVTDVIIQADLYFPPTSGVCSPGIEFTKLLNTITPGSGTTPQALTATTELTNAKTTT